ncbi:exopolyphosphatase PRUNE1 [Rhincodon typus]|uniref:exopolyphosphatase PRUNE1 n=1 Tax=Rhincodon typus TaxID=259920 RepID=UPI0009A4166E|nr:exopolyphosphatase PRUNE1 [Rhincodon typus]
MEPFLRGCMTPLERGAPSIHVVLGNEACDLDSMVSAIAFAYFLSKTALDQKAAFVPVLNIPRSEFPLRGECMFLLRENCLSEDLLVFRDEIDLHGLHRDGRLVLTLVDHNVLPRGDSALEDVVTEVVDHRRLERPLTPGLAVTTEPVGSCATLVTERIIRKAPDILDRQLAYVLRSTILLDCINMAPEAGKVTPKDTEYVTTLESRFTDLPPRAVVFDSLQRAKFDVSGLTIEQMLRKDLKVLSGGDILLAISAVYLRLEELLARPGLKEGFEEFCRARGYSVLVVMTIAFEQKSEPFRQLAVYSPHCNLRESVSRALEESETPLLQLMPLISPDSEIVAYHQGNGQASRKKVLPVIVDFLKAWEAGRSDPAVVSWGWGTVSRVPRGQEEDGEEAACDEVYLPPTPMNSLVEGCPLEGGLPKLSQEAILERFDKMAAEGPVVDSSNH